MSIIKTAFLILINSILIDFGLLEEECMMQQALNNSRNQFSPAEFNLAIKKKLHLSSTEQATIQVIFYEEEASGEGFTSQSNGSVPNTFFYNINSE